MWDEIAGWVGLAGAGWINLNLSRDAYMRMIRKEFPQRYNDSSYMQRNSPHWSDWPVIMASVALTPITLPILTVLSIKRKTVGTNKEIWERRKAEGIKFEADMKALKEKEERLAKERREAKRQLDLERDKIVRELMGHTDRAYLDMWTPNNPRWQSESYDIRKGVVRKEATYYVDGLEQTFIKEERIEPR